MRYSAFPHSQAHKGARQLFDPLIAKTFGLVYLVSGSLIILFYLKAAVAKNRLPKRQFDAQLLTSDRAKACQKCASQYQSDIPVEGRAKGDRAHHCSQCRTCIQKMDHHCTFILNCVGLVNHKDFFNLLLHATFLAVLVTSETCVLSYCLYDKYGRSYSSGALFLAGLVLGNILMFLLASLGACASLFFYHCRMAVTSLTTLEDMETNGVPVYSFGTLYNLKAFFGKYYLAFLPINVTRWHEGFYFPRPGESDEYCSVDLIGTEREESVIDSRRSYSIDEVLELLPKGASEGKAIYQFGDSQFE